MLFPPRASRTLTNSHGSLAPGIGEGRFKFTAYLLCLGGSERKPSGASYDVGRKRLWGWCAQRVRVLDQGVFVWLSFPLTLVTLAKVPSVDNPFPEAAAAGIGFLQPIDHY